MVDQSDLDECPKERDSAFEAINKEQAEYDKQLLALSAAFLGVALAFVKDVVPLKDAVHLWTFDAALGLLLLCVLTVLGTFQYSIHGHFRLMEYWEKKRTLLAQHTEKAEIEKQLNELWKCLNGVANNIKIANRATGLMFAAGTIFLVVFVATNMHRQACLAHSSGDSSPKQAASPQAAPPSHPSSLSSTHDHRPK